MQDYASGDKQNREHKLSQASWLLSWNTKYNVRRWENSQITRGNLPVKKFDSQHVVNIVMDTSHANMGNY